MLGRTLAILILLSSAVSAGAAAIQDILISGNVRIDPTTILYYVRSKVGEDYDEQKVKDDFQRLWETGFFSDLKVEEKDGEKGKIITFILKERPVLKAIEYQGNKAVSTSAIQDEYKKEKVELSTNAVYNPAMAYKAKRVIEKLLRDKGQQFASVNLELNPTGATDAQLVFKINEGPKARIEKIDFTGNEILSARLLRRSMKNQKQHWIFSFLSSKNVYSKEKFDEDLDSARMKYWEHGRLRVQIDQPKIRTEDFKTFFLRRDRKKLFFAIPVQEGPEYKTSSIKIEGNTVFPVDRLMRLIVLKVGEPYDIVQRNNSLKAIRDLYAERGYFYAQPGASDNINDETKTVDLTIMIQENDLCYLNRIEFKGNVTTKDKVLRREIMMDEGDIFNSKRFADSLKRIQQLGLIEITEEPKIEPDPDTKNRLNVTLLVKEAQRNQIQFGGGVSQLEGTFGSLSYSTTNFLGAGETMNLDLTGGKLTTNVRVSLTEPYFLDKPMTLGFDLFKSDNRYTYYTFRQHRTGGSIIFGFPFGDTFWRNSYLYTYQALKYTDLDPTLITNPYYQSGRESALTYTIFRNTVDSPISPWAGDRWSLTNLIAGGPLGGDFKYYRPEIEIVRYQPITRKTNLGMRFQIQYAHAFGGQALPFRGSIFMGGENTVRGYPYMSIGPRDSNGNIIGGGKSLLLNLEYYIPIAGPFKAILFFDAGNVWATNKGYKPFDMVTSTGIEGRFFIPVFRVPFRLIGAWNPNLNPTIATLENIKKFEFKFSIGTTF